MTLDIPAEFASDIVDRDGAGGPDWLRRLPRVVSQLCDEWQLTREGSSWYGYCAIALPVRRADDTPAVLKVSWPGPDQAPEAPTLRAWAGDGAVRLLAHDAEHWALLLERLDGSRDLTSVPIGVAVEVIGSLLARLHQAPTPVEAATRGHRRSMGRADPVVVDRRRSAVAEARTRRGGRHLPGAR